MKVLGVDVSDVKIGIGPAAVVTVAVCGWIISTLVWANNLETKVLEQKAELTLKLQQQTHVVERQQQVAETQQKTIDVLLQQQQQVNNALIEISTELRLRRERER